MKYKNHPSITALKEKSKISKFIFHEVGNEKIINEIKRLNKNKPSQKFDIPITIIDKSTNIFEDFLAEKSSKLADITALHKKREKSQQGKLQTSQYSTNNADFEKVTVRNIAF